MTNYFASFLTSLLLISQIIFMSSPVYAALPVPNADLQIGVTSSADNSQIFLTFTNNGPDLASNVKITSTLPTGYSGFVTHSIFPSPGGCSNVNNSLLCEISSLPPGNSGRIDIVIYKSSNMPHLSPVVSSIRSDVLDKNFSNNFNVLRWNTSSDKSNCKNGGWSTYTDPSFHNQGECIRYFNTFNL